MKKIPRSHQYVTKLLFLFVAILLLTGCAPSSVKKEPVIEEVPEISETNDSRERRHNKLTQYWETNDTPILSGFYNLYNCEVVQVDDPEYPYRMWIFGSSTRTSEYSGYDSIFHARGKTLTEWEVYCGTSTAGSQTSSSQQLWDTTMTPSLWQPVMVHAGLHYDCIHNGDPSVVYRDGSYYMAYSSVGSYEKDSGVILIGCVMGAISQDGINWEKSESPILIWEQEYDRIPGEETKEGSYHRPSLLWDQAEEKWKIWFDYYLPGTFLSMGYAVNHGDFLDAGDWQILHAGDTPHLKDWPNPDVIKINDTYYAFSDVPNFGTSLGAQNDRQIVMAYSQNGWDWTVLGRILPESTKYGTHLPQAYVQEEQGTVFLYVFYSMVVYQDLPNYSAANFMRIPFKELERLIEENR